MGLFLSVVIPFMDTVRIDPRGAVIFEAGKDLEISVGKQPRNGIGVGLTWHLGNPEPKTRR